MSIRSWIIRKLGEETSHDVHSQGAHGLRIERDGCPDAVVHCVENDSAGPFTVEDFEAAVGSMPELQFVVLVRRAASNEVYERASELGICVAGFSELKSALDTDFNIGHHRSREQAYLLSRLEGHRGVRRVRRIGSSAFAIEGEGTRPSFTILTIEHYDLSSDSVYELIAQNDESHIDAIVTTNPNCRGFAPDALRAGREADVRILTLNDLGDLLSAP